MIILHVVNDFLIGGISLIVYQLVQNVDAKHIVIGFQGHRGFDQKIFDDFQALDNVECLIFENEEYEGLLEVIKDKEVDIVHKQTGGGDFPEWVKTVKEKCLNIPIIETLCCPRRSVLPDSHVDAIIGLAEITQSLNKPRKIHVIPQPCDISLREYKRPCWDNLTRIIVGRLARYEPFKNTDFIARLAHYMYSQEEMRNRVEFVIAGFPFNENYYRSIKEMEIPGFFRVMGSIEDKLSFVDDLDLVIDPGRDEWNYVFIESMARGIPVITSENKYYGTWAIGSRLPYNGVSVYAEEIMRYYWNVDHYMKKSQEAIAKFKEVDFTAETYGKRLTALYDRVLNV